MVLGVWYKTMEREVGRRVGGYEFNEYNWTLTLGLDRLFWAYWLIARNTVDMSSAMG